MKKKKAISWIRAHKTDLLVAGGIALSAIGAIILFKRWDADKRGMIADAVGITDHPFADSNSAPEVLKKESDLVIRVIDVPRHIRNLPKGHSPSKAKILEASEAGIELASHQTIVSSYPRRYAA